MPTLSAPRMAAPAAAPARGAPDPLLAGPLACAGGVLVYDALPCAQTRSAMVAEAWTHYAEANRQECAEDDGAEGRGGTPERALASTGGGPAQDAFYASPELASFLSQLCGTPMVPSGNRGSYSFYVEPGDHLGLHLDIPTCDLTLITVLHDSTPPSDASGGLAVWRRLLGQPLSLARAHPHEAEHVAATAGQSIVILGGHVPHRVLPIGPGGGQRVISALCFQAV